MPAIRRVSLALTCAGMALCHLSLGPTAGAQIFGFTDVTAQAGIDASYERSQAVSLPFPDILHFHAGGAVGDFNRDGWPDLFVLSGTANPDRLYINNGDGTFTDRASEWGVDRRHHGVAPIVGDYNNNGYLDIFVLSFGTSQGTFQTRKHILYRNNGDGTFTDVAEEAGVNSNGPYVTTTGACFGDYDLDGDLDLFITVWDVVGTDGAGHRLFRNEGDGTFTDVTSQAIDLGGDRVAGFNPVFADMNGDGYPELLIAGDFASSRYLLNNANGTFTALPRESCGFDSDWNAMGSFVCDLNGDGWLDWYISNISVAVAEDPTGYAGQVLYQNQGGANMCADVAPGAGIEVGYWGWGADGADFNNDGLVDIAQTNGWRNTSTGTWEGRPTLLWLNDGDGTYTEVGSSSGFDDRDQGRGIVTFDYDLDGDVDIAVFNNEGPVKLFRNELSGLARNSIRVVLDTSARPDLAPDGYGSTIELTAGGVTQSRYIDGGPTFMAMSDLAEHFGLGAVGLVDEIVVRWNDGRATVLTDVPVNQSVTIAPGEACVGDCDGSGAIDFNDLVAMLFDFGNTPLRCDLDMSGAVDFKDAVAALMRYGPCDE